MVVVPIYCEANFFGDNETFWNISSRTEAIINNNHVSIFFHVLRMSVSSCLMRVIFVKINNILDGYLTNLIPGIKNQGKCGGFVYLQEKI